MKEVYQLEDLTSREALDAGAEKPAKLAVLGHPVAHSASPAMHQAALDAAGIDMRYIRLDLQPGTLPEAIKRMRELGFVGCNVTVPHKKEAFDCADELTADAKMLETVNTLVFDSTILGHNTDASGFVRAIREDFGIDLGDLRVLILGAGGGAGSAVAIQCARSGCEQMCLVNRTLEKAQTLATKIEQLLPHDDRLAGPGEKITCFTPEDPALRETAGHVELIINATSLGLKNTDPLPVSDSLIEPHHLVYDMIYNPPLTPLLKYAQAAGARTGNGTSMLLHQGALSFETWFPQARDPLAEMRKGLLAT